jgi:hypothetical protein
MQWRKMSASLNLSSAKRRFSSSNGVVEIVDILKEAMPVRASQTREKFEDAYCMETLVFVLWAAVGMQTVASWMRCKS